MRTRFFSALVPFTLACAMVPLMSSDVAGQAAATVAKSSGAAGSARASSVPRTPWGDPDLQGEWTSQSELGVPFERPAEFGTRQVLT
ncbi:MAG: hypothetical protein ACRD2A_25405, partial [Vicinamibacterales bacterium]